MKPTTESSIGSTANLPSPVISPDGAIVMVLSGAARGTVCRLPGENGHRVVIGKSSTADLVLPDDTVSRQHLAIVRRDGGLWLEDLGSRNGVRIGGAKVEQAMLSPGTVIRAGEVDLLIGVELSDVVMTPSDNEQFGITLGKGLPMRRIFSVLEKLARTDASILLLGETGTGKDTLARSIHMESHRTEGPFEVVDCGAISSTLIESELFGHERGAFTGAVSTHVGAFERAAGGTLFLDEIGELAPELQPKLLRVLETREFRRVGGTKMLTADVRIVAATTRDLEQARAARTFRDDLFYRLAVVSIDVPPLRQRQQDIGPLAARLLQNAGLAVEVDAQALATLESYPWPGNVRELRNVLERCAYLSIAEGSARLKLQGFPPHRAPAASEETHDDPATFDENRSYRELHAEAEARFEASYVRWLLERHDGNVAAAARAARMDRNHLTDLARKHNVERRRRS